MQRVSIVEFCVEFWAYKRTKELVYFLVLAEFARRLHSRSELAACSPIPRARALYFTHPVLTMAQYSDSPASLTVLLYASVASTKPGSILVDAVAVCQDLAELVIDWLHVVTVTP